MNVHVQRKIFGNKQNKILVLIYLINYLHEWYPMKVLRVDRWFATQHQQALVTQRTPWWVRIIASKASKWPGAVISMTTVPVLCMLSSQTLIELMEAILFFLSSLQSEQIWLGKCLVSNIHCMLTSLSLSLSLSL